jgi:cytochrome c peroxidase
MIARAQPAVICRSCLEATIDYYPTAGGNLCKACYERLVARQQRERSQANNAIDVLAGRFPWYWLECWHRPKGSPIALGGGEQKLKGRMKAIFAAIAILCCFALNARAFAQAIPIPADNPPDARKAEIGKQLFFEPRLSINNTTSCADCHQPARGFTDNKNVSEGILQSNGRRAVGTRNAPTILNAAYTRNQFWDIVSPDGLEDQMWRPAQNPVEHGRQSPRQVVDRLNRTGYRGEFRQVFGTDVTQTGVAACIAQFERTIVATDTNFQHYRAGETWAMPAAEKRGLAIFTSRGCTACHDGATLTDALPHNIGTEFFARRGNLAAADRGRAGVTNNPADERAFKTPPLVAVALTPPYMHNGSFPTLRNVIDYFDAGGYLRTRDGRLIRDPNIDPRIRPLGLSEQDKRDLETFLTVSTMPRDYPKIAQPILPP